MSRGRRWAGAALVAVLVVTATPGVAASPASAESPRDVPAFVDHPVEGPHVVGDRFGAYRRPGRRHEGIDLFAPKGRPVRATFSGVIDDIDLDGGPTDPGADPVAQARAGNALTLEHAGGWSVDYFHLNDDTPGTDDGRGTFEHAFISQLREGAWVLGGQVLGFLGDSGNAETTPPHLHFELRDPDRVPVDPEPSVRAAGDAGSPTAVAIGLRPSGGHWVLDAEGGVHAMDGAPHLGEPAFGWPVARDLAVMPDGAGYVVLDAWGGLHRYGSAGSGLGGVSGPYWPGHDVARAVAIAPDGAGFVVLDAWGGTHRRGSLAGLGPTLGAYWPGWDIARDVAVMPDGAGYAVLDGYGGVHPVGSASAVVAAHGTPYWNGWDMGRSLALGASGLAVLDGWGAVHGRGSFGGLDAGSWRPGTSWADVAGPPHAGRVVAVRSDGLQLAG